MTKQLTDNEQEFRDNARADYFFGWKYETTNVVDYNAGFIAGLSYNQAKIDKLISYAKGELTRSEIEEILNG